MDAIVDSTLLALPVMGLLSGHGPLQLMRAAAVPMIAAALAIAAAAACVRPSEGTSGGA